ncbi:hypothetical protein AMD27_03820 [Acinetobacter sp. TGL-Y2]|uniref:PAAR domain-containing protein n=1 Tax=Acinetobacter sp. TGL-Y2 TaxID=1407071 RepID=UPI0007A662E9|nr:PAAR domain-containing protein [Acinetobacter sp. TGL-Y2]AMW78104.1 hypothetical protein AMD27_03820 [Acinetobacter sp. TGL-Y2]
MKALITIGCKTDHGGIVVEADSSFLVEGKSVHLEGMKHVCPKCKKSVSAISLGKGFLTVGSKTIIMAGDKTTCGATFLPQQNLVVRANGSGLGKANAASSSFMTNKQYSGQYQLINELDGQPYKNIKYNITYDDESSVEGITDEEGMTEKLSYRDQPNTITIQVAEDEGW